MAPRCRLAEEASDEDKRAWGRNEGGWKGRVKKGDEGEDPVDRWKMEKRIG